MLILELMALQNSQLSGYFAYCYVEQIILFQPNNRQHCLTLLGRLIGKIVRHINRPKQCSVGLYVTLCVEQTEKLRPGAEMALQKMAAQR